MPGANLIPFLVFVPIAALGVYAALCIKRALDLHYRYEERKAEAEDLFVKAINDEIKRLRRKKEFENENLGK